MWLAELPHDLKLTVPVEATTGAVTDLADQLIELRVEKVTVESTSDYVRHEGA